MKIKILLILTVVFSLEIFLSFTHISYAISSSGLGIYPNQSEWDPKNDATKSWFIYNLNSGEIKKSKVNIRNESDKPISLEIYPVDAVTTKDGSFAPNSQDSIRKDLGAWINMSTSELSLGPNETKTVDFAINVPQNANIGDHMAAIIIQNKNISESQIKTSMHVVNRLGARIYVTVIGEKIEKLEIQKFNNTNENSQFVFLLTLANLGNTRIVPKGTIEIKDESGIVVDEINLTQREIFPKDTIVLPTKWNKPLSGKFTALATVEYNNQKLTKELNLNNNKEQVLGVQNIVSNKNRNVFSFITQITVIILIMVICLFVLIKCLL
jgi:hypothetical protein